MKKTIFLLTAFLLYSTSWCQTPITPVTDGFSNWLFVNSDKALQVRYKEAKKESEISYLEVQFKINFDAPVFCSHQICLGYLMVFSYPSLDNQGNIETSYKFFNTFKGVYTVPQNIPMKMTFNDGSKRFLRQEGFFYTTADNNTEMPATNLFSNCVDIILSNNPNEHRCKPYYSNFKDAEAIVLK